MMKSAGYSFVSSFITVNAITLKQHNRFSLNGFRGNLAKSRKLSAGAQRSQLYTEATMVAGKYYPPWFSVAPMMDWTDHHYRTLARLITKHAWLYTEMLAAETIVYQEDNLDRFLAFSPEQHPIVLQIGGNNLENLAKATKLANAYHYDEINFKSLWMPKSESSWTWLLWCASNAGSKDICSMTLKFVGEAMSVIAANTNVPVTVKCRIGVDNHDSYNELCDFIYKVSSLSPTRHFIIHSRKALLNGVSPRDNRTIPPLKYEYYYALLRDFPDLQFTINGGINSVEGVNAARRAGAHGVMVGRAAYNKVLELRPFCVLNSPWNTLGYVDSAVYGAAYTYITRHQVLEQYEAYADSVLGTYGNGRPNIRDLVKPLLGLFYSEPGNGLWKRKADAAFQSCKTMKSFFKETLVAIPDSVLDAPLAAEAPASGSGDAFANLHDLLPQPYTARDRELQELYA
ncbi:DUS-like, FMN-binding domain [Dillenia turbinata]|uniref:DUS-like, FMN-binding domain n=1 Tax=Dillenia turbinata TaxID=194707 RepID=A0AAN8VF06_9MAGN